MSFSWLLESLALLLLLLLPAGQSQAALVDGSSSLCKCTPRDATSSAYITSLNSYTSQMRTLLNDVSTQLQSLGLKLSDFPASTLAKILQATASASEATRVANELLATVNSNSSSSGSTATTVAPSCTVNTSSQFFGSSVSAALISGGSYSSGTNQWQLPLTGAALLVDYGVGGCSNTTQYIQRVCISGNPSQLYLFVQPTAVSGSNLISESLTVSSQTGDVCVNVQQSVLALSLLPKSLKTAQAGSSSYEFSVTVTGCFSAIDAACLASVSTAATTATTQTTAATTTAASCVNGNAMSETTVLPTTFIYFANLTHSTGYVLSVDYTNVFVADLTAGGCRPAPSITRVCAAGNFARMRLGKLVDTSGTIQPLPGSENVTAPSPYSRFCYDYNGTISLFSLEPGDLFPSQPEYRMFPEIYGCFHPVTSSCTTKASCSSPTEVTSHTQLLPQQSLTASNLRYVSGSGWQTVGTSGTLSIDTTAAGCRQPGPVTDFCITSGSNIASASLSVIFANADFNSTQSLATSSFPACATFQQLLYVSSLRLTLTATSGNVATAQIFVVACLSALPASCTTTTTATTTTVATTSATETCRSDLPVITDSSADIPAKAITGGSYDSATSSWTVAKNASLLLDLTVGGCRQSAFLLQLCLLGNAASVRVDYVLESSTRVILPESQSSSATAAGSALCFSFGSVRAKSLVLQPTSLKPDFASAAAYSLKVNLSACYSTIYASCYDPICSCDSTHRPVFNSKSYYNIEFTVISGSYSVYQSSYASSLTSGYKDMWDKTDSMIAGNFRNYSDKYESIELVSFVSGSVKFSGRLVMYSGNYTASELDTALTAGLSADTSGGTYVVNATSIVITDITTTTTAPTTTTTAINLALLLGLLIPLLILAIVLIVVLVVLLCKCCGCCCFAGAKGANSASSSSLSSGLSTREKGTMVSPLPQQKSPRGEDYVIQDGVVPPDPKTAASPRRRSADADEEKDRRQRLQPYPKQPASDEQMADVADRRLKDRLGVVDDDERKDARKPGRRARRRQQVSPQQGDGDTESEEEERDEEDEEDEDEEEEEGELALASEAQPQHFSKQRLEPRPRTPRTMTIETFTYQIGERRQAWSEDED